VTSLDLYLLAGVGAFVIGIYSVVVRAHLVWKVLAVNVMSSGIFMILLAAPARLDPAVAAPVPQAMVLTGIVVAVAVTAVMLGIALRVTVRTGHPYLGDPEPPGRGGGPP
jgi:multicomponent Na+:H+ antiporter subunit C